MGTLWELFPISAKYFKWVEIISNIPNLTNQSSKSAISLTLPRPYLSSPYGNSSLALASFQRTNRLHMLYLSPSFRRTHPIPSLRYNEYQETLVGRPWTIPHWLIMWAHSVSQLAGPTTVLSTYSEKSYRVGSIGDCELELIVGDLHCEEPFSCLWRPQCTLGRIYGVYWTRSEWECDINRALAQLNLTVTHFVHQSSVEAIRLYI